MTMRLRACLGGVALMSLAACESIPQNVKIDVDGQTLELKRKPAPAETNSAEPR